MMERTIEQELNGASGEELNIPAEAAEVRRGMDFSFLKAPTGEGSIEEYLQHPMNFNESRGMARILRGLSGMFDNLNYALVDIVVGIMDLSKSSKLRGANENDRYANISERGGVS